jgi:hypothetical protein
LDHSAGSAKGFARTARRERSPKREFPGGRALAGGVSTRSCVTRITTRNNWQALLAPGARAVAPEVDRHGKRLRTQPLPNSSCYQRYEGDELPDRSPRETHRGLAGPAE